MTCERLQQMTKSCPDNRVQYFFLIILYAVEALRATSSVMHQSISAGPRTPAPPPPPPPPTTGYCGAFARRFRLGGRAFANFVLPGGRAFAKPGALHKLLTRTRFPIRK